MNDKLESKIIKGIAKFSDLRFKNESNDLNILAVVLCGVGDTVVSVPFLRLLRQNNPKAHITVVCKKSNYALYEYLPYADRVVACSFYDHVKHKFEKNVMYARKFAKDNLNDRCYDYVLLPHYPSTAEERLITAFSPAKKRIAYVWTDDDSYVSGLNIKIDDYKVKTNVERGLDILKWLGYDITNDYLELWTDEKDKEFVQHMIQQSGMNLNAIKVIVFLSSTRACKNWGADRFAEVCFRLREKYNIEIILLGAKSDTAEYGKDFCSRIDGVHNFIGMTSLRQTIEMIKQADFFLGGDTGTTHIASAVHTAGISVTKDYPGAKHRGGVGNQKFWPWQAPEIRVLRPKEPLPGCENKACYHEDGPHCIRQITVDEVTAEAENIIIDILSKKQK